MAPALFLAPGQFGYLRSAEKTDVKNIARSTGPNHPDSPIRTPNTRPSIGTLTSLDKQTLLIPGSYINFTLTCFDQIV
jgi:hypothetical protein